MDIFTFTPGGAETLDAFNGRLAAYAADNDVTGVVSSVVGATLALSLTVAEDIPAPILLRPFVAAFSPEALPTLEIALSAVLDVIKAEHNEEEEITSVPVECRVLAAPHGPTNQAGYAVFLIEVGALEDEE